MLVFEVLRLTAGVRIYRERLLCFATLVGNVGLRILAKDVRFCLVLPLSVDICSCSEHPAMIVA